ncbi:hypothetical protein J2T13_001517 [Paenibacillus sp. DS2015]|uniref:hypothetical protein n=1 Tax=Paenibacillus sp. DS2015 TaxID=3373917 RepID=UPI003D1968D1
MSIVFTLIVNAIIWIENILFEDYDWGFLEQLTYESNSVAEGIVFTIVNYNPLYLSGGFIGLSIFELVCSAFFLYVTVKLIDRKVEV